MPCPDLQPLLDLLLVPAREVNPPSDGDIQSAEHELGTALSPQYRELIGRLGAGMIDDYVMLLGPGPVDRSIQIETRGLAECTATKSFIEEFGIPAPRPLYPDEDGVFPWALTIDGDLFFLSPINDNWVGVFPRQSNSWQTLDYGVVSFLFGMLTRQFEVDCLPSYFPSADHSFAPAQVKKSKTK